MARTTFDRFGKPVVVTDEIERTNFVAIDDVDSEPASDNLVGGTDDDAAGTVGTGDRANSGESGRSYRQVGEKFFIDPTDSTISPRTGKPKRAYTRRVKSSTVDQNATTNANTAILTANLEKVLINLHKMGAGFLAEPELEITETEATLLAEALKEVAQAYNLTAVFNPRTQALVDMGIAVTTVYGGRVMTILKKKTRPRGNVTVMPSQPNNAAS